MGGGASHCIDKDCELSEEQKAQLRHIVKVHDTQMKLGDFCDPAASGASVAPRPRSRLRAECRAEFFAQLPSLANPIPEAHEFVTGIPHHNDHTAKMHYMHQITQTIEEHRASGGSERWKLADAFPNLSPPSCGMEALSEESWQALKNSSTSARRPTL